MEKNTNNPTDQKCPLCGSMLKDVEETSTGKKLQRCSAGSWNPETKKTEGCPYVKWLDSVKQELDEKCPKCGANLILQTTRTGKKMKKCSKGGWDRDAKMATGCDYVQWINGTKQELDELCPKCQAKLLLVTTATNKRMKKCSTGGWDRKKRVATGCTYVEWLPADVPDNGNEDLPEFES